MKYILSLLIAVAFVFPFAVSAGHESETECEEGFILENVQTKEATEHHEAHYEDVCVEDEDYVSPAEECTESGGEWIDEECVYPEPTPEPTPAPQGSGAVSGFNKFIACQWEWFADDPRCEGLNGQASTEVPTLESMLEELKNLLTELLRLQTLVLELSS